MHLLWGVATVAVAFPFLPRRARLALKARWSRQLLDCLGVRLYVTGSPLAGGLFVANHISWLDIYAINAAAPTAFVSKAEVRQWPIIGWLSLRTETLFLQRGSRAAAARIKEDMIEALRRRWRVGLFPEGTTSFGEGVMPFHGALFQAAIDAGVRLAPVALRYVGADGRASGEAAYVGDTSLGESLLAIARASHLSVAVTFLPSLDAAASDRRHLAAHAHRMIAHALTAGLTPNPMVRPGDDKAVETPAGPPGAPWSDCRPTDSPNPGPAASLPA